MHNASSTLRIGRPFGAGLLLPSLLAAFQMLPAHAQVAAESGNIAAGSAAPSRAQPGTRVARGSNGATGQGRAAQLGGPSCTGEALAPGKLTVPVGKSTLVRLPEPIINRTVGNPEIVQAMLVSSQALYLVGLDVGTTNMIIQGKSGACTAMDVVVSMDPGGLQATLAELMPEEKEIKVTAAADTLVMSGTVADAAAAHRAVELANAFVRRPLSAARSGVVQGDAKAGGGGQPGSGQARVVNLLNISAPQQVMLEVKVAEVSKSLLEKLGVRTNLATTDGSWAYTLLSNFLTGTSNGIVDAVKSNGNRFTLEAEKRDGSVKILAEPNVMAISGQEGSFLAGGKILIPVAQDSNNGGIKVTLEEKEFGVGVRFTPTVLAGGRINLKVAPEVSELSREGVGISAIGVAGSAILPLITTRRASTTVQLFDGQSFAIGGLIKNNVVANIKALPILGEIPVLGTLFRSTDFQQDKSELLFVITPRLVKPLPPNYALPTDNFIDPSRAELFIGGRLEGKVPVAPASANRPVAQVDAGDMQGNAPAGFELK